MEESKILQWTRKHKFATGLILIFAGLLILSFLPGLLGLVQYGGKQSYDYHSGNYVGVDSPSPISSPSYFGSLEMEFFDDTWSRQNLSTTSTELEIREGSIEVKSENAENDFEILKEIVNQQEGYVETSRKSETNTLLSFNAQIKVPAENFDSFLDEVENVFKVEDFNLSNYKIDVQRQIDELYIIEQALEDYMFLREETLELERGEERIELLSRITQEMQNLARQQRNIERDLEGKEKQSDLATLNIVFKETLRPDLWPEDLGNYFYDRINWGIESIATTSLSLIANSFVLFVKVIEYIIYAVIVVVPVTFAWNTWSNIRRKKKDN